MRQVTTRIAALLALCVIAGAGRAADPEPAAPAAAPMRIEQLDWMAGCWSYQAGKRLVEEQWMVPRGGSMLGMSRTTESGATREWEAMRIEERDGILVFTARPSGQSGASFRAIEIGERRIVFANPQHDFPQRVLYTLRDDGRLVGRVEGEREGQTRGIDYPYDRAGCPGPEAAGTD